MSTLTVTELIAHYKADPVSGYRKLEYGTRCNYDRLLRRIDHDHGTDRIANIKYRHLLLWHRQWTGVVEGEPAPAKLKIAMAHSLVGMLRTLVGFGTTILEDAECERLSVVLHRSKFENSKSRQEFMTAEQVVAVRTMAYEIGSRSIALAQALAFENTFRQGDVIGKWVPQGEPGISDVLHHGKKWLGGLRWEEIDADLILRHVTSKKKKPVVKDLKLAPMVIEELTRGYPGLVVNRRLLPAHGPVIICESTGRPYTNNHFRFEWRKIARAAGIPDHIFQMDTRASAITEATDAGVPLEHIKHAAAHSQISTTEKYARGGTEKDAKSQAERVRHRNAKTAGGH